MKSRNDLPFILNERGLIGKGAEIGVCRGAFSKHILSNWRGKTLNLIDPWVHQGSVLDKSDVSDVEHLMNLEACKEAMKGFRHRVNFFKMFSVDAAKHAEDGSYDFVYIDAKHDYRSVWADLTAWYSKVKSGGIFAGHDYKNSCVRKNLVEVKRAVDAFFYQKPEKVLTTTEDSLPSWYVFKS